jgi:hypothetical protein
MHLLYLDESGNPYGADDRHFVLAGISAFEQNTYFLARDVDAIKQKYFPTLPPIDFHTSHIGAGRGFWRHVDKATRQAILIELGDVIGKSAASVRLFGSVVEKSAILHGESAVKIAMEQVCKRFDIMLKRQFNEHNEKQRGLLVFAESNYQTRAKIWVQGFRELGTQWGSCTISATSPISFRQKRVGSFSWPISFLTPYTCSTRRRILRWLVLSFIDSIKKMAPCMA